MSAGPPPGKRLDTRGPARCGPARPAADLAELVRLMALLRSPEGCPWDRAQDHRSLRPFLLEEAYEVLQAIDAADPQALCHELGDLLLQIVFHAQLAAERGEFQIEDVVSAICAKLIARHPHVFGGEPLPDAEAVLEQWDALKRAGAPASAAARLREVALSLPALARAQTVQAHAARLGFDWPDVAGPLAKLREELEELSQLARCPATGAERVEQEVGDLLFSVVNVARWLRVDAEQALRETVGRFLDRFRQMEKLAEDAGQRLEGMSLPEMDSLWEQAKQAEPPRQAPSARS